MANAAGPTKRETAYHEAGHAFVAIALGLPFRYVTVEPTATSLGHVMHLRFAKSFRLDLNCDLRTRDLVERYAMCGLAGFAAQLKFLRRKYDGAVWEGSRRDYE